MSRCETTLSATPPIRQLYVLIRDARRRRPHLGIEFVSALRVPDETPRSKNADRASALRDGRPELDGYRDRREAVVRRQRKRVRGSGQEPREHVANHREECGRNLLARLELVPPAILDATGPVPRTSEIFVVLGNGRVARDDYVVLEVDEVWPRVRHGA
jgi:hypothetical protein